MRRSLVWVWVGALALAACSGGATETKVPTELPAGEVAPPPVDPAEPVAPIDPAAPVDPVAPVDPAAPVNAAATPPVDPAAAPAAPGAPPVPGAPAAPATPGAPATPAAAPGAAPVAEAPPAAPPAGDAVAATDPAASAPPPARGPTTYRLDPGSSWIYAVLKYDRNTLIKGHDHVVKASSFDGTVVWSPNDPSACKVDISFPVNALTIDPPGARSRAGLDGETNEGDLPKIKENMLSKTQLNSSVYPRISYTSTSCSGTSGKVTVAGNLTMHGVSKALSITMDVTEDGSSFKAKGSTNITHRMFGFDPFVAALGALKNDDNLKLVIDVRGSR
jgi:polyisoprenoid-binding protein YceI